MELGDLVLQKATTTAHIQYSLHRAMSSDLVSGATTPYSQSIASPGELLKHSENLITHCMRVHQPLANALPKPD